MHVRQIFQCAVLQINVSPLSAYKLQGIQTEDSLKKEVDQNIEMMQPTLFSW